MCELVTKDEIEINDGGDNEVVGREEGKKVEVNGGIVLEVARGMRIVEQFGDAGPRGAGNTVGGLRMVEEEILRGLEAGWMEAGWTEGRG